MSIYRVHQQRAAEKREAAQQAPNRDGRQQTARALFGLPKFRDRSVRGRRESVECVGPDRGRVLRCEPRRRKKERGKRCGKRERAKPFGPITERGEGGERRGGEQRALRDSGRALREAEPVDADQQRPCQRDDSSGRARSERTPRDRGIRDDEIVFVEELRDERRERGERGKAREPVADFYRKEDRRGDHGWNEEYVCDLRRARRRAEGMSDGRRRELNR